MLMKKSKSGGFQWDGFAVELMLDRGDEYQDVLDKAGEVLDLPNVSARHQPTLLTCGGAIIPKKED